MAGAKKNQFDGMTDEQIVSKAAALKEMYGKVPSKERPQEFYDFGNKAMEIERARRATRAQKRASRETSFNNGLKTTWKVPAGKERTRNRLAALIMQESGPRTSATPEYTMLGERLVASVFKNYMDLHGMTAAELIEGKGRYGGPGYLPSVNDVQRNPDRKPYHWANDKFNPMTFIQDDTTFNHMTNAVRLATALVNGTLRPLTNATNFKHLPPSEEFNGMTRVSYDFGNIPIPTNHVLKLYVDPSEKSATQDTKGGSTRAAIGGGETPGAPESSPAPQSPASAQQGGPRIVINPQVFSDKRDALCVAFNEAFRIVMEMNGFEPASEPTEAQRKFFSDTAYANDELQLRRTILARIATLDTSVKDPTDEQLEETAEMLEMVMEVGAPQDEWEQSAVKRLHDVVVKSLESTRANGSGTSGPDSTPRGSARQDLEAAAAASG